MPLNFFVPKEDQTTEHFRFTLVEDGMENLHQGFRKEMLANSLAQMRVLAKKIGLSDTGRLKRQAFAAALEPYIFFTTRAEAEAQFPLLAEPIAETELALQTQVCALIYYRIRNNADLINYRAHFHAKESEIRAPLKTIQMEAMRADQRTKGLVPPAWWEAGDWVTEEDWNKAAVEPAFVAPYLKVVVEVTERDHDGYCSGVERDYDDTHFIHSRGGEKVEIEERRYRMVAALPLKDKKGAAWEFVGSAFDPNWRCASGGSGVCGVRPSVSFVSMERVA